MFMKSIALIFAGGVGQRMKRKDLPKQFIKVNDRPIIIHTLEHFQRNKKIDEICIVCIENYIDYLKLYEKEGRNITNAEAGIMRKLASVRTFFNYFYKHK